ncbi:MAG: dihydroneopterin aldolase [Acidimicrobiia bacterium]|nr:dihydroneopterin aldolase [Acidimicrobiia bacterium]
MADDRIELRGLEVFARHGVYDDEQSAGQLFKIDVVVTVDLSRAGAMDELADTLDYGRMAMLVHDTVESERWDLIERVATRVTEVVLASDDRIERATVTVHKPSAPIPLQFDDVSVTIERAR